MTLKNMRKRAQQDSKWNQLKMAEFWIHLCATFWALTPAVRPFCFSFSECSGVEEKKRNPKEFRRSPKTHKDCKQIPREPTRISSEAKGAQNELKRESKGVQKNLQRAERI